MVHTYPQVKRSSTLVLFLVTIFIGIIIFSMYNLFKNFLIQFNFPLCKSSNLDHSLFQKFGTQTTCTVDPKWIYHMHAWTNRKGPYSQGSQDLYLQKIFSIINTTNKYFVEFGFNEQGYDTGGSGANTRKLFEEGWRGLLLDGSHENQKINLKKYYLFASNIATIFEENNVPKDLDFLSCDMDSHDLWVFRAILQAGYRPRVITTEYNSNYPITDTITLIDPSIVQDSTYRANFKFIFSHCAWGAGAGAFRFVAEAHGYTMVGRVGSLDLIWLRSDLLVKDCFLVPSFEWFFRNAPIGRLHQRAQSSPNILLQIVDYKTYVITGGNLTISNKAARAILKQRQLPCFKDIENSL